MNAFEKYIQDSGVSVSGFARMVGRSPSTLLRVLKGERDPSVKLARDIERGTAGAVRADEFMSICLSQTRRGRP